MTSFIEILRLAVTSADNEVRQNNEARLIEYRQKDSNQFLIDSMNHLNDQVTDPSLKQAIATLIGISFRSELHPGEGIWWYKIDKAVREEVKKLCLQNLISKNEVIKTAIADLISNIYVLDVPNKDWSNLVSTLSTNTTHSNVDIQRSAMLTLGSICDKLAINNIRPSKEDIDAIMTGVAGGLVEEQKNDQIKLTAIKALQDSIPMFKEELQKDASRDFFLTLILKNATHTNEEIVLKAVQCLIDIIKTCYRYLHNRYMDVILDCTIALMKKNAPSIVVATTEFWDSVAQYEVKLLEKKQNEDSSIIFHNIVASYSPKITQTLLENLMKKDTEDIDSGMSVHAVTLDCLIHVNALAGESNKSLNIEFISNQIGGENDKSKVAALLCFEAMILGYNQDIVNLIDSSFANIVEFLKINATVCKAALKVITAISEKYPSFMLIDKVTNIWLEILIKIVHSDISLASPVFTIFGNLGQDIFKRGTDNVEFVNKLVEICKILTEVCFTQCSSRNLYVISDCFVAVMNLVKGMPHVSNHNAFLEFSNSCLLNTHNLNSEVKLAIKDGLLISILTSLYILKRKGATKGDLNQQVVSGIFEFCMQECRSNKESFPNALMVIVAISCLLKSEFDASKVQDICGLASVALKNSNNEDLMRAGLESVGDLVRNFSEAMAPHVSSLLDYMMESLQKTTLPKDLGVWIIAATGDIALGCPREIKSRLQNILRIFLLAFEAVVLLLTTEVAFTNKNDSASLEYADKMRTTLAESLHYIIHQLVTIQGLRDNQVDSDLIAFLPYLLIFISKNLEEEKQITSDFFVTSTLLSLSTMASHRIITKDNIPGSFLQHYGPRLSLNTPSKSQNIEVFQQLSSTLGY